MPERPVPPKGTLRTTSSVDDTSFLPHAVHFGTSVARFATPNYAVVEVSYLPGHLSPHHAHESPFIHTVLDGNALQEVPERAVRQRGDVCFYPAGRRHSHAVLEGGWRALAIDILPSYAADFAEHGADLSKPFAVSDPDVFRSVTRLWNEIRNPDPLSRLQVDALVVDICVSMVRLHRERNTTATPTWLRRVMGLVDERCHEDFSIDELAAEVGMHPAYLTRAFRRLRGETLGDHVRRLRIDKARRLLESSSESLAQIASEIGYHDESHFSRAFKNVVGTTPGRYRNVVRSSPTRPMMPVSLPD